MPTAQAQNLIWYHFDEDDIPTAARQPWAQIGAAATAIDTEGLRITAAATAGTLWRPMADGDGNNAERRSTDRATIQWRVDGESQAPAWASGLSPIVAGIDDRRRPIGVSIGPSLNWIDPYTGDDLGVIVPSFPWFRYNTFRLVKERSALYRLFVNGEDVGTIPYLHIPVRGSAILSPPRFFWGHLDPAGSSEALWEFVEAGLNKEPPRQWKVDRAFNSAPKPIQDQENGRWRALRRMISGKVQDVIEAMDEVRTLTTAYRQSFQRYDFSGAILPDDEVPPWVLVGTPANFSILRERVRIDVGTTVDAARADMDSSVLQTVEFRAAATFTFRGGTANDPQGRLGPYLEIRNGDRSVRAELFQPLPGTSDAAAWAVTEGPDAGPVTFLTSRFWQVNELGSHRVELQVLGRRLVLLIVNGRPVECIDYGDLGFASALTQIFVGRNGQPGGTGIATAVDIEDALAETRYVDLARRELFLQVVAERLVLTGGCEDNDYLDTLMRNRFGLNEMRGTTIGIVLETQRLSCSRDSDLIVETQPAGWYLERTYPTCGGPVYLDSASTLQTLYLEVHDRSPNFTAQQLAEILRLYVVPAGTIELRYIISLATLLTVASVNAGTTTFTVALPAGFEVGDAVLVRNAANTVQATGTILMIDYTTGAVETTLLSAGPFAIGSTMRKTLLET